MRLSFLHPTGRKAREPELGEVLAKVMKQGGGGSPSCQFHPDFYGGAKFLRALSSNLTLPEEQLRVRLVNGSSRCSGFVEVLLVTSWEPVCMVDGDRLTTKAVCEVLGCGALEKATYLMPPTSELSPGATSGNISSAGNTTWAQAPTVRCSRADWQLCKVVDHECSSDKRLVRVTCAGTCACPLTTPQF